MTDFKWVTKDFAVAPQIGDDDVARAAKLGIRTIVNNRPEGEEPSQPSGPAIEAQARDQGLAYHALPFRGPPPPLTVNALADVLKSAQTPVLAYCRTGTRSIMAWAMAQALTGARPTEEIIALAANAGYDIAGARGALEALAPRT